MSALLTAAETARRLGIGRNRAQAAIRAGQIPSVAVGKERMVSESALDAWLASAGAALPEPVSLPAVRAAKRGPRPTGPATDQIRAVAR